MTDQQLRYERPPASRTMDSDDGGPTTPEGPAVLGPGIGEEVPADPAPPPTRPALSRQRIVDSALQLVERLGLEGLTMRRVAAALQVTPMSLYNHVSDKAELVDLMVDYVIEGVVARSAEDQGDWEARIRALCRRNYEVWKAHPGIVRVYADGVTLGPNGLANLEHGVEILRQGGFSDDDAGSAVMLLYRWSMATLLVGRTRPPAPDQPPRPRASSKEERLAAYFSALPPDRIPNIEASVMSLSGTSIDFGLDVIISGLKARLAATSEAHGPAPDEPEMASEAPN